MNTRKRILALLLTLCMVISMLPMGVFAIEPDPPAEAAPPTVLSDATPPATVCTLSGATDAAKNTAYATFGEAVTAIGNDSKDSKAYVITLTADCSHASTMPARDVTIKSDTADLTKAPTLSVTTFLVTAGSYAGTSKTHFENINIVDTVANSNTMHAYGTVSLKHCTVTGTSSGALLNIPGTVSLDDVTIKNNDTGGAIVNGIYPITINNSSITGKIALGTGKLVLQDVPKTDYNIVVSSASGAKQIATATGIAAEAAAKITVNGGADWKAVANGDNIVLERLPVRYVIANGNASGDGSSATDQPYATLQKAYDEVPDNGEIRLLWGSTTAAAGTGIGALNCNINKNVTINSYIMLKDGTIKKGTAADNEINTPVDPNGAWTITRHAELTGAHMLNITAGTVTLSHIILDGGAIWDNAAALKTRTNSGVVCSGNTANQLVMVNGAGTGAGLTLDNGAVLQNNQRTDGATSGVTGGDTGSALCVINHGTATMKAGAKILNNDVTSAIGDGAAVSVWDAGTFNMTGGTVSGNTSTRHGAIRVLGTGAMTMSGGEVTGNAVHGKSIDSRYTPTVGGIFSDSSLTVSETAKITGNTNVSVTPTIPANVSGAFAIGADLAAGANIGVTGAADTQVSTATAVAADAAFIHPDADGLFVKLQGDKLMLKATTAVVYVSGAGNDDNDGSFAHPVATLGLAYAQVQDGGTICVLSDLTASQQTSFNSAKSITISSYTAENTESTGEGFTVTRDAKLTSGAAFTLSAGAVTLKHITLDGNAMWDNAGMLMTRKATNTTAHQLIQITGGELSLNDGAIVQNHARVTTVEAVGDKGGAIYLTGPTAKLTMNTGAELRNNYTGGTSTAGDGGAVSIWDGALFTMNDGFIMGNTANRMGGAVRVSSTGSNLGQFVINGGSITCNALIGNTSEGGGVSVSGGKLSIASVQNTTPIIIKNNTLNDGTVNNVMTVANGLELGDMSGKTSDIGITTAVAGTVFATSALNTDVPYFHSDDLAYEVVLDGNALKLAALSNGVYVADGTAGANTVPAGADDTNAGTKDAPFLTLAKAYERVANGGNIYVMEDMAVGATQTFNVPGKAATITSCDASGAAITDKALAHTLTRTVDDSAFLVNGGTVTLKNIKLTDTSSHTSAPICIQTLGKLVLDTGATIENTESNFGAIYVFSGTLEMRDGAAITGNENIGVFASDSDTVQGMGGAVTLEGHTSPAIFNMTGGTISGNSTTNASSHGGAIGILSGGKLKLSGNPKIIGNTSNGVANNVYLSADNNKMITVTGNLADTAKIGVSGVTGVMDEHGAFATAIETAANVSLITQDAVASNFPVAVHGSDKKTLVWAASNTNWLDAVAAEANGFGWNDDAANPDGINDGGPANNGFPNGIVIDTPWKLYSLSWAIKNNYNSLGAKYADGYYYIKKDIDLSQFFWTPIGTADIPFTGVFEGDSMHTVSGIRYNGASSLHGLFGAVGKLGGVTHTIPAGKGTAPLNSELLGTMIKLVTVDGTGYNQWTKSADGTRDGYMGAIAARATNATIQSCAVTNLNISGNANGDMYVGGIVGEATNCVLVNNSTCGSGSAMTLNADTDHKDTAKASLAYAGGTVGKATNTQILSNTVGGTNALTVNAVPQDAMDCMYAGAVAGYAKGGTIRGEDYTKVNKTVVLAQSLGAKSNAYAGGVVGYAENLTINGSKVGANSDETHSVTASCYPGDTTGSNYAGGLVGYGESIVLVDCSTGSDAGTNGYTVTAGQGSENVAGGLVGVANDSRIITSSVTNVKIDAPAANGHAGGLAGYFTATKKAALGDKNAVGVMAQCYAVDAAVTSASGIHCPMIATAKNAYIISCYATAATPEAAGVYAFAAAPGTTLVGCYSTASSAPKLVANATDATFENCYCASGAGVVAPADATALNKTQTPIALANMQQPNDTALVAALGFALRGQANTAQYAAMTGLDMGYKAGTSTADAANNYKAPTFAKMFVLTVNSKPSSLYGTYTVTVGGKNIAGANAAGLNQYVIPEGSTVVTEGVLNSAYSSAVSAPVTINSIAEDKTVLVTFTPTVRYGWTINNDITGKTNNGYTDITDKALASSGSSIRGNTIAGWKKTEGAKPWASNDEHKIKTVFVACDGEFGALINRYDLTTGWVLTSGGTGKAYAQFTNENGATSADAAALVNSISFNGTGDGSPAVYVCLDERTHGKMFFSNNSAYELSSIATNWGGAKALAENTTLCSKNGHLVVIGSAEEHTFLAEHVKTNAWTAAKVAVQGTNTTLTNWSWDVTDATADETAYLQNKASWTVGEPNTSGLNATYNYAGHFDDTNQNNFALIEYDYLNSSAATDWQGYSAAASGTVTVHKPYIPPYIPEPDPNPNPDITIEPGPGKVTISPVNPGPGTLVTITVEPETGWEIGTVTIVTDPGGVPVTVTGTNPITYIAPKPAKVKITVTYKRLPVSPETSGVAKLLNSDKHIAYMLGDDSGNFAPEAGITRGEVAQMFYNLLRNQSVATESVFSDVAQNAWYAKAINTLSALGILKGNGDGTYKPDANISRAEFTAIAMRFAKSIKGEVSFNDVPSSLWAHDAITGAAQYGWIVGYDDGSFKPNGEIKRCEAAKIVNVMLGRFADAKAISASTSLKQFPDVPKTHWAYLEIMEASNTHEFTKPSYRVELWK